MKKIFALTVIIFVLVIAAVTNPTKVDYVTWMKEKVIKESNNMLVTGAVSLLGNSLIESTTTSQNLVFFSIFNTNINGQNSKVVGLFHNFIPLKFSPPTVKPVSISSPQSYVSKTPAEAEYPSSSVIDPIPATQYGGTIIVAGKTGTYELPLIGVSGTYGLDIKPSVLPKDELKDLQFDIPSDMVNQLAIFWVNDGSDSGITFIAPKDWKVKRAVFGVNGSCGITIVSDLSSQHPQSFNIMSTHSFGSVADYVGIYFPNLRNWAIKNSPTKPNTIPNINIVDLNKHAVAYSYKNPSEDYLTNGIAVENHGLNLYFTQGDIVSDDKKLATTMLDYYLQTLSKYRNDN